MVIYAYWFTFGNLPGGPNKWPVMAQSTIHLTRRPLYSALFDYLSSFSIVRHTIKKAMVFSPSLSHAGWFESRLKLRWLELSVESRFQWKQSLNVKRDFDKKNLSEKSGCCKHHVFYQHCNISRFLVRGVEPFQNSKTETDSDWVEYSRLWQLCTLQCFTIG